MFCAFWFVNAFLATTACNFSTFAPPRVARTRQSFNALTWKRASRHSGVQFSISPLATWLRACRFSEPTSTHKSFEKRSVYFVRVSLLLIFTCIPKVLAHIGAAVAHMHGLAWVHRDIKPANIAVLDGHAKASGSGNYLLVRRTGLNGSFLSNERPMHVGAGTKCYVSLWISWGMVAKRNPISHSISNTFNYRLS